MMLRQFLHTIKRISRRREVAVVSALLILFLTVSSYLSYNPEYTKSIKENLPDIESIKDTLPELPDLPDFDLPDLPDFPTIFGSGAEESGGDAEDVLNFEKAKEFYNHVFKMILKADPKVHKLDKFKSEERLPNIRFDEETDIEYTKEYLSKFLEVSPEQLANLTNSHSQIVSELPIVNTTSLYTGNGIVMVGGGKFTWLSLLSLKSLRNLGSRLPVEIMIPSMEDYEEELCEHIFPQYNARCLVLPRILGAYGASIKGYQYKSLAVLLSSFKNLLLLDADNIPISIPDDIFNQEPFTSQGLIIWPDFWRRTTSPDFYTIANIEIKNKRVMKGVTQSEKIQTGVPLHHLQNAIPDPTSESGQLVINKNQHFKSMVLALYYNIYGPDYYYPLLSQGAIGEGDKETFLAAAVALGEPFHQMNQSLSALGRFDSKDQFHGVAMGQYDPVQDWAKLKGKDKADPRILFIHANFPKLDPVVVMKERPNFEGDQRIRMFGEGLPQRIGYDFEIFQWQNMKYLLCERDIKFKIFAKTNMKEVCDEIDTHLEFLDKTSKRFPF